MSKILLLEDDVSLVKNEGLILTREKILDELWDSNKDFVDDNTLSVYVRRLREKVESNPSQPEHLITVRGFGYQWKRYPHEAISGQTNQVFLLLSHSLSSHFIRERRLAIFPSDRFCKGNALHKGKYNDIRIIGARGFRRRNRCSACQYLTGVYRISERSWKTYCICRRLVISVSDERRFYVFMEKGSVISESRKYHAAIYSRGLFLPFASNQ